MKKNQSFLLMLILIQTLFVILSCKKDKNIISISGTVYDPNTKTKIEGALVTLSAIKVTSGFYNPNYSIINTTSSNADGSFSFEFKKEITAGYRFIISKENYFETISDVKDDDIKSGVPYYPEFNLYPVAFIKLHVVNSSPYDENDYIAYSYSSGTVQCPGCCDKTTYKGYGMGYDTLLKCMTYGNQKVKIVWNYKKGGNVYKESKEIFATAFDTTSYNIYY